MTQSYATLPNRAIIKVTGADAKQFLQGLITQDIELLTPENMLYSAFLTPQGKYLSDFFITQHNDEIWLEGDKEKMQNLLKKLRLHKLRSDVTLDYFNHAVYVSFDKGVYQDPRHKDMGYRSYQKPDGVDDLIETYEQKRISLSIPNGVTDLTEGKSTPFEGNLDLLNAISFTKGCYLGQELISRIHHRGLIKKRLVAHDGRLILQHVV